MIRLILACHLAMFFIGVGVAWGGTLCPNMESQHTAPVSELVDNTFRLVYRSGVCGPARFSTSRNHSSDGVECKG